MFEARHLIPESQIFAPVS